MSYSKIYSRVSWQNEPSTATPLNQTNLNNMDATIDVLDSRIVNIDGRLEGLEGYETEVIRYATQAANSKRDSEAYAVGKRDGVDVPVGDDTYHNNSKYYAELAGTSESNAGASATSAGTSATTANARALDSEAWAIGQRNGTAVPTDDPAYHNNAKYYSEQASTASSGASTAAETATDNAETSEAYAVGKRNGVDVPSSDVTYQNNSKYYSGVAGSSATAASLSASNAATSETNAASSASDSYNYEELSKSYAIGTGGIVRQGDATDNSKYYSQVSAEKASDAAVILQQVRDYASLVIPNLLLDPSDGCLYVEELTGKTVEFLLDDGVLYYKFVAA